MKTLNFDAHGLIPAIAQDALTGEIRMMAWMNQAALDRTLATRRATFFSRSRQQLWVKGETSGNTLHVRQVFVDCDGDTLLLLVDPEGPSCHTGRPTCFFSELDAVESNAVEPITAESSEREPSTPEPNTAAPSAPSNPARPLLGALEALLAERRRSSGDRSYTKALLDAGAGKIADKVREEADELGRALVAESDERVAAEAADLVYHVLVGLLARGVAWRSVIEVLAARVGTSGHVEKASRG